MEATKHPEWWARAPLSELTAKLVDGSHNPPSKQTAGLPMLSAINIAEYQIRFSTYRLISQADFEAEHQRTRVQAGDVLLTIVGAIGRTAIVPQDMKPFVLQRSVAVLTPVLINSKFLMYQLESPGISAFFKKNARGTAQKGVYLRTLSSMEIWFPSLSEQSRIVAKIEALFSELDKGIEALKTAREQLKVYRQAVLKQAFEGKLTAQWREENKDKLESPEQLLACIQKEREVRYRQQLVDWKAALKEWEAKGREGKKPGKPTKLVDIANKANEYLDKLPHLPIGWIWLPLDIVAQAIDPQPSHRTPPKVDGGIPYVGVGDINEQTGEFDFVSARKVSQSILDQHKKRYDVKDGDFIIGKIGTIGKPFRIPCERSYTLSANVVLVQPIQAQVDPDYLFWLCSSPIIERQFEKGAKATTQAAFGIKKVRTLMLPICSKPEQKELLMSLSRHLDVIQQNENEITSDLARVQVLRQSILKKAFSGQLVPQDPTDEPASVLLERIKAEKAQQTGSKSAKTSTRTTRSVHKEVN